MAFVPASFRTPGSPSRPAALNAGPQDYVMPQVPSSSPAISKAAGGQSGRQAPATATSLRLRPGQTAPGAPQTPAAFASNTGAGATAMRQSSQPPPPKSFTPAALSTNAGAPQVGGSLRAPPKTRSLTPKAFAANTSTGKAAQTRSLTPSAFAANTATSGGGAAGSLRAPSFKKVAGPPRTTSLTPAAFAANASTPSGVPPTREASSSLPPKSAPALTPAGFGQPATGGSLRAPPRQQPQGAGQTRSLTPAAFAPPTAGKPSGPEFVPDSATPANASYGSYVLPVPVAVESVQVVANSPATSTSPVVPKSTTHLTPAAFAPPPSSLGSRGRSPVPPTEAPALPTRPSTEPLACDQRAMPPATTSIPPAGFDRPRTVSPPPVGQPRMVPLSIKPAGLKFTSSPQPSLATPAPRAHSRSPPAPSRSPQPFPIRSPRTSPLMPVALTVSSANLPAQAPEPSHRSMMSSLATSADFSPVMTPQSSKYNLAADMVYGGNVPTEASSKALAPSQRSQTRLEAPQAPGTFLAAAQRSASPHKSGGYDAPVVCDFSSDDDDDGAGSSAPSTLVYMQQAPEVHAKTPPGTDDNEDEDHDDDGKKAGAVLAVGVGAQPVVAGLVACAVGAPVAMAAGVALITPVLLLAGAALLFPRALESEDQQTRGEQSSQP